MHQSIPMNLVNVRFLLFILPFCRRCGIGGTRAIYMETMHKGSCRTEPQNAIFPNLERHRHRERHNLVIHCTCPQPEKFTVLIQPGWRLCNDLVDALIEAVVETFMHQLPPASMPLNTAGQ